MLMKLFGKKIFYSIMFGFIVTKDSVCLMAPPDIMLPVSMTALIMSLISDYRVKACPS